MQTLFQVGGLERLREYVEPLGARRVLLLVSSSRRFVDRATAALSGLEVEVFDGARVHVPRPTVDAALAAVDRAEADTVIALGGGAAIGLGKALCLQRDLRLVAIPTTYSGSEMTNVWGITDGGDKQTGRDDRVRASLVIYDASLTTQLPVTLTVQSLTNSLAQIVSALSTDSIEHPDDVLPTVGELWRAMNGLRAAPHDLARRERAFAAASRAGRVVDMGRLGAQHALAHKLGGRFDLEHSAVHSVVLIAFTAWLRGQRPALGAALDGAAGVLGLEVALYDLLRDSGAAVSLRELGVPEDGLRALLEAHPELPADIAWSAYRGARPSMAGSPGGA